ncbi:nitroreductase/quinone reductase family protein [Tsukamurella soli]|uniref:Nitroreductase family deazaflavin-dependent oxidoreductase n=1 Tax=Tsukamurella soli TaxID=644556 RepID=A0ABP8JTE7_9ACTN
MAAGIKFKVITAVQRRVNPIMRRAPRQQLIETIGRRSGQPRVTPIGGRRSGAEFWLVSEHGDRSDYVKNILANPRVRVRDRGTWLSGTAHVLRDDDARARLAQLPRANSAAVAAMGTDLLTIRVDLGR